MTNYQDVFKRYEKKYLLNRMQHQTLLQLLDVYMTKDAYGMHTIGNIYFDTNSYDLIRTSIEKPVYKEKLRLRCYGIPKPQDKVFIEIKKKFQGVVYKRRVQMPLEEAQRYLLKKDASGVYGQILNEIDWFMNRYQPAPKVYISYDRTALFGNEDPNLRVTFDQNIRFRESQLDLSKGSWGSSLLNHDETLMEIKFPGTIPLWLSQLLTNLEIYPTSYSKYGNCYKEHLIHHIDSKGGIICA